MKGMVFEEDSLERLCSFPIKARQNAGFQLDRVQRGLEPKNFKPMNTIGPGVMEIRIWDEAGTFRVIYTARLADNVHVLHAFQKKTQTTSQRDLDIARRRYAALMRNQS